MSIPLNHLRYFYEVARQRSITRAARVLRVSQPGVSKIVRQIEEQKNAVLFERGHHGVRLTEQGQALYAGCSKIFEELERVEAPFENRSSTIVGPLAIAASDNLCLHVFPDIIRDVLAKHPGITPKVFVGTSEAIQAEVLDGRAELGFLFAAPDKRKFQVTKIASIRFSIVSSRRVDLRKLDDLLYIGSRRGDYPGAFPALRLLASLGIRPKRWIETNLQECQKSLAIAGVGYSVIPAFAAREEITRGSLFEVRLPADVRDRFVWPLYSIGRSSSALSRTSREFCDRLFETIEGRAAR